MLKICSIAHSVSIHFTACSYYALHLYIPNHSRHAHKRDPAISLALAFRLLALPGVYSIQNHAHFSDTILNGANFTISNHTALKFSNKES